MIKYKLKSPCNEEYKMTLQAPEGWRIRLSTGKTDGRGIEIYDDDLMISNMNIVCRVFWSDTKDRWAVMYRMGSEKLYYKSLAWACKNCMVDNSITVFETVKKIPSKYRNPYDLNTYGGLKRKPSKYPL